MTLRHRIEPDSRSVQDIDQGALVPLADPAWMLSRQWWTGELAGSDGGTPVRTRVTFSTEGLAPADVDPQSVVPSAYLAVQDAPLSMREAAALGLSILARMDDEISHMASIIEQGGDRSGNLREALDLLSRKRSEMPEAFPLEANTPVLRRMPPHQRVDGAAVRDAVLNEAPEARRLLSDGVQLWVRGQGEGGAAFSAETARHSAQITTATDVIKIKEARGPRLRWSEVQGYDVWEEAATETRASVPVRLSYAGDAPAAWWGLEETGVAYASAPAGPSDLGQLLIAAAFAHPGALGWLVTVDASANSLLHVGEVALFDGFGRETTVTRADKGAAVAWKDDSAAQWMPLLADAPLLEGAPTDLIAFGLDETDNIVWMEERIVPDSDGRGTHPKPARPDRSTSDPVFALRVPSPSTWHPYLLQADGTLLRQSLPRHAQGGALDAVAPGTSLAPERMALIPQQIPPKGFALQRRWVLGRAPDGSRQVWRVNGTADAKLSGSAGLAHDLVLYPQAQ
ncbi:hypothetical protein [uncultured Roseobacter sp.]|uniref:hypothetical protein n=1 Tax=uncultured Roseobacter sp. TaxID=114847 RepID=UPI00261A13DC|nr:hypothetical protein [uncultured Roseobacter sp.]